MAANWDKFKTDLVDLFKSKKVKNGDELAKHITNLYDKTVKTADDILYKNRPQKVNKSLLEKWLKLAFKTAFKDSSGVVSKRIIRVGFATGITLYWTGGTLSPTIPPPGSIRVISNVILFPGVPPTINIDISSSPEKTATIITMALRLHLLTITGITTSLVPVGTVNVPRPFPFSGLK